MLSKFEGQEIVSKNKTNFETGNLRSCPKIEISLLDADGNIRDVQKPSPHATGGRTKQSGRIVIVATSPETTFYSDGQVLTKDFTPDQGKQIVIA